MIKPVKIEIQTIEHFDNNDNSLGFLNHEEHINLLSQIVKEAVFGYYLVFNNKKHHIDIMGNLDTYPKGLYSQFLDESLKLWQERDKKLKKK